MSKKSGGKQAFLRDDWYFQDGLRITQKIYIESTYGTCYNKNIQKILKKKIL